MTSAAVQGLLTFSFARLGLPAFLLLLLLAPAVRGQSYVPSPPALTAASCGPQQRFVSIGTTDSSNSTLFQYNAQGSKLGTYWSPYYQYVYTTPFTNPAFGVRISQLSVGLLDNSALTAPVSIRLGLYIFQQSEANAMSFSLASLIGMTDEITLYPSRDQVLYANLLQPVQLLSEGDYGIGIYASDQFFIAGGARGSGFSGFGEFWYYDANYPMTYDDYQVPHAIYLDAGDRAHPVAASGCVDDRPLNQPNQTVFAFCALIETYVREPAKNADYYVASNTNTTHYTGLIAIDNSTRVSSAFGTGFPIVFMEGEITITTNAGTYYGSPLGIAAESFSFRPQKSPYFSAASNLLYLNGTAAGNIDTGGIVLITARQQYNLFFTGAAKDRGINQRDQSGIPISNLYFSSFLIYPKADLDTVLLGCTVPLDHSYVPDSFSCPSDAAPVSFGDVNTADLDPYELDEVGDYFIPNMLSFRYFAVHTPDTTAYQLSYYTLANPEAIVHMRLGLFTTNTSVINSFSSTPIFNLLASTAELTLINVDDTTVVANLPTPVPLTQGRMYAIGVWVDAMIYGPSAHWGVDAPGLQLSYDSVDGVGSFPASVLALGGFTGTQPMAVSACVAGQRLITFTWCASFGSYFTLFNLEYEQKRYYSGTFYALSTQHKNEWGSYWIVVAGNGTTLVNTTLITADPPPPAPPLSPNRTVLVAGTWNLNNFQTQSPDFLYDTTTTQQAVALDRQGVQIIVNDDANQVYAVILSSFLARGSPTLVYQEYIEFDYYDDYRLNPNTVDRLTVNKQGEGSVPSCPVDYVPYNSIRPLVVPLLGACRGAASVEAVYGDNNVFDYAHRAEGNALAPQTVYTVPFTALAASVVNQVSLDVLNNTQYKSNISLYIGLYDAAGRLMTQVSPISLVEVVDQMIVANLQPAVTIPVDGSYFIAMLVDAPLDVATSTVLTPSMHWPGVGVGLPNQFTAGTSRPTVPLTAYGCVNASHYFCGSFQYYQGDNYFPTTYDYLYQGLLLLDRASSSNSYGTFSPVKYGVGHLSLFARVARWPTQFHLGAVELQLTAAGNLSGSANLVYTAPFNGQPLDSNGLSFTSDFGDGPVYMSLYYDSSLGRYQDSTQAMLGRERLTTVVLKPVEPAVGVPQCSVLDLPLLLLPNSSTTNLSTCSSATPPVMWGDDLSDDYFYDSEGLQSNFYRYITLTPIITGRTFSTINSLALAMMQNANMFAHIRLALYDGNQTLVMGSQEVQVDNVKDSILFFPLLSPVKLLPSTQYYIAYWADATLYTAEGDAYDAECYYGLSYVYNDDLRLSPWPVNIGTYEADFYNCPPLPVAALGCSATGELPPPVEPCPLAAEQGASTATLLAVAVVAALLSMGLTLLAVWMHITGKCAWCRRDARGLAMSDGDSGSSRPRKDDLRTALMD